MLNQPVDGQLTQASKTSCQDSDGSYLGLGFRRSLFNDPFGILLTKPTDMGCKTPTAPQTKADSCTILNDLGFIHLVTVRLGTMARGCPCPREAFSLPREEQSCVASGENDS